MPGRFACLDPRHACRTSSARQWRRHPVADLIGNAGDQPIAVSIPSRLPRAGRTSRRTASPELDTATRILALEGVADPSNVGGLFRVAACLLSGRLLLDPATADPFYRKALRTSMGAVLHLPFARLTPWPGCDRQYKREGFACWR